MKGEEERRIEDSVKSSLRLLEETEQIAIKTAEEIYSQGEKLQRIDRNLDNIGLNLEIAKKSSRSLSSFWGSIVEYFRPLPRDFSKDHNEEKIDRNDDIDKMGYSCSKSENVFDDLNQSLVKLKHKSLLMNKELVHQNEVIQNITDKSENSRNTIKTINEKLNKILK